MRGGQRAFEMRQRQSEVGRPPPPATAGPRPDWRLNAVLAVLTAADIDFLCTLPEAVDGWTDLRGAGELCTAARLMLLEVIDPAGLVAFEVQLVEVHGTRSRLTALGRSVRAAIARA